MPWTAAQSKITGYKYCVPPGGSLVSPGDIVLGTYGDPNQCQAALTAQSTSPASGTMPFSGQPSGIASVSPPAVFLSIPSTYTPIVANTPAEAKTAIQTGVVNCQTLVDDITAFVQGNLTATLAECSKGPAACEAYIRNNSSGLIAAGGAACSAALNAVISQLTSQYASASGIASAAGTSPFQTISNPISGPAPTATPQPLGTFNTGFTPGFGQQTIPAGCTPPQWTGPTAPYVVQLAPACKVYVVPGPGTYVGVPTLDGTCKYNGPLWSYGDGGPNGEQFWIMPFGVQGVDVPWAVGNVANRLLQSVAEGLALIASQCTGASPTIPPTVTPVTTPPQPITTSPPSPPPTTSPPTTTTPPVCTPPDTPVVSYRPISTNLPIPTAPGVNAVNICDYVSQMTPYFVQMGTALINGNILSRDTAASLFSLYGTSTDKVVDGFIDYMNNIYGQNTFKPLIDGWNNAVSYYPYSMGNDLLALLTLKSVLLAIIEAKYDASNNYTGVVTFKVSGAPEIFGVGVGGSVDSNWTSSISDHASFTAVVIPLVEILDYSIRLTAQTGIPAPTEAIELYLANAITLDHCKCLVELQGEIWAEFAPLILARRTRPDVLQSVSLYLRKSITLEQLVERLHGLGVTNDDDISAILELSKFIPGPGDIIRFMVRNVEDPAIVSTFGLDDEFQAKYQGLTRSWAEAQGLDDEVAGRFWRAHWVIPSPGQLYTMLQRLRPDNVPAGVNPNEWITTPENVYLALSENDILPFWRDRLIAISYSPLGKIDARRAFQFGSLDFNGLISAYRDQGYDEEKATIIALNTQYQIRKTYQSNKWVSVYVKGGINSTELNAYLMADGASQDIANATLAYADNVVKANLRETCIKALHNGYMISGLSQQEATTALIALGQEASQATTTVSHWACELASTSKVLSAGSLCGYFQDGLITQDDFVRRLMHLGYSSTDASVIVLDCFGKIIVKRQHSAAQLAAKIAAANKQNAALLSKANKQLEQAAKVEEKLRASEGRKARAVSKALLDAAMAYAGKTQTDLDIVSQRMDAAVQNLVASHGATYGDAVQAVTETAAKWSKGLPEDLTLLSEQGYAASLSFDAIGEAEAANG